MNNLSRTHTNLIKNISNNNMLGESAQQFIFSGGMKCHEELSSTAVDASKPSKISYVSWGVVMIKDTVWGNLLTDRNFQGGIPFGVCGNWHRGKSPACYPHLHLHLVGGW